MKHILIIFMSTLTLMGTIYPTALGQDADLQPSYLRCEYRVDPLGIDVQDPRLSWELQSLDLQKRGQKQTAYHILVASSLDKLSQDQGDLWDSGKMLSDQTSQIVYRGSILKSNMDCFWKVRVWDEEDHASAWSQPARWSMGLLKETDWQAKWIEKPFRESFERCFWVWYPEGDSRTSTAEGTYYFRKTFTLDSPAQAAKMLITADDRFTLSIDGEKIGESESGEFAWDKPYYFNVELDAGKHAIAIKAANETEGPAGLTGKLMIISDKQQRVILIDESWKTSKEAQSGWMDTDFDDSQWKNASQLGHVGQNNNPWGVPGDEDDLILPPVPYFHKNFTLEKPIKRAMVYATAQGLYELNLNGEKVGEDVFTPGWSDYRKRMYYNAYDITDQLQEGENGIGVYLSDGWYSGYLAWGKIRNRYEGDPALRVQINVEYADGSEQIIGTDTTWVVVNDTPIREADFLMGEMYDANKEIPGFGASDFPYSNESGDFVLNDEWNSAVLSHPSNRPFEQLDAYPGVTVKEIKEFPAQKVSEPKPGVFVYDLGQNMVGWVRLKARGHAGTRIKLRFAEVLNPDGTLYVENLRTARATDYYIKKSDGIETWEPRFTFHGFRYVEVTGYPGHPPLDAVTGVVLHSDISPAGSFECSNSMVNQLIHNIEWGMRGNYLELPTDCPQRDERLGWTGDAQVFIRTGTYNMDIASFFTKWIVDLVDSQRDDGSFTDVAPDVGLGSGVAAWADAGIICPYNIYKVYGDTRILRKHYEAMKDYIEYLKEHSDNLIRPAFGYGDWLSLNADTPKDVLATAYFADVTRLMSEIASALGERNDAQEYKKLYEDIKAAYNKAFVKNNGEVEGKTQTAYVLSLVNDLIPERNIPNARYNLVRDLQVRDYHFSTGFCGLRDLLPVLTELDRLDLAYRLLLNETFPSWGYEIKNGATTVWERWDGWTDEFGFQTPGMNSFNHYAYGAVGEWLYSVVGGIDLIEPGYKVIKIHPQPGGDFSYVNARYRSINGWIGSEWRDDENTYTLNVRIPPNTTAQVYVKTNDPQDVTESGKSIDEIDSIRFLEMKGDYAVYEVESGGYQFAVNKK